MLWGACGVDISGPRLALLVDDTAKTLQTWRPGILNAEQVVAPSSQLSTSVGRVSKKPRG